MAEGPKEMWLKALKNRIMADGPKRDLWLKAQTKCENLFTFLEAKLAK